MNEATETRYQCVGICITDPDSGYCLGCGRPPESIPDVVVELQPVVVDTQPSGSTDPDTPA